jgi:hypothetical protein
VSIPPELLHLAVTHGPHLLKELWDGVQSDRQRHQQATLTPDAVSRFFNTQEQDQRDNPLALPDAKEKRKFRAQAALDLKDLRALRRSIEQLHPVIFTCLKCGKTVPLDSGPLKCTACGNVMGVTPCARCGQVMLHSGVGPTACLTCGALVQHAKQVSVTRRLLAGQVGEAILRLTELRAVYAPPPTKKP